jgi:hypothetical protein
MIQKVTEIKKKEIGKHSCLCILPHCISEIDKTDGQKAIKI